MLDNVFLIMLRAAGCSLLQQLIEFYFHFQVFFSNFERAQWGDGWKKVTEVSLLIRNDCVKTMKGAPKPVFCREGKEETITFAVAVHLSALNNFQQVCKKVEWQSCLCKMLQFWSICHADSCTVCSMYILLNFC